MVPQHRQSDTEADLRAYLLADRIAFRKQMCTTLCEDPAWSSTAWEQLSTGVDALAGGQPYRLHGFELPPGHWALVHGVNADWVLGGDDVLRPTSS
jgi:hypothetical protein